MVQNVGCSSFHIIFHWHRTSLYLGFRTLLNVVSSTYNNIIFTSEICLCNSAPFLFILLLFKK